MKKFYALISIILAILLIATPMSVFAELDSTDVHDEAHDHDDCGHEHSSHTADELNLFSTPPAQPASVLIDQEHLGEDGHDVCGDDTSSCTDCGGDGILESSCMDCAGAGFCAMCGSSGTEDITCTDCGGDGILESSCMDCAGAGFCAMCSGSGDDGSGSCPYCGDSGDCPSCAGTGDGPCFTCSGTGVETITCTHCSGSGDCPSCAGTGDEPCSTCGSTGILGNAHWLAQTFTSGYTKDLTKIQVNIADTNAFASDIYFEIWDTSAGEPNAPISSQEILNGAAVGATSAWSEISFSSQPALIAGNQYAIVMYADEYDWDWHGHTAGTYASGSGWSSTDIGSTWTEMPAFDFTFRTYVDVIIPVIKIRTLADLNNMRNAPSGHYKLMNDIDASDSVSWNVLSDNTIFSPGQMPITMATGWEPIGNLSVPFTGIFDGNGFAISNLFINKPAQDYVGYFGFVTGNAVIKNMNLENADITGHDYTGSIVGFHEGNLLENCWASGTLTGSLYVGGIGGNVTTNVSKIFSSVDVTGFNYIGGLFGSFGAYMVELAYNYGNVTTTAANNFNTGGLIGVMHSGAQIYACGNYGHVSATTLNSSGSNIAGAIGHMKSGTMATECFSEGNVLGNYVAGGFVGTMNGVVYDCYATGDVNGFNIVGGFAGLYGNDMSAEIYNSYATGAVSYRSVPDMYGGFAGGNNSAMLDNSYWDTDTSNTMNGVAGTAADPSGVQGKTTSEMHQQATFISWDFTSVWRIDEGNDYPQLRAPPSFVHNLTELQEMNNNKAGNYILMNDIDASATSGWAGGFDPIGDNGAPFTGSLDGQGYSITNLFVGRGSENYIGLFGRIDTGGLVSNLNLIDNSINGDQNVGGLVGYNDGNISNCYFTGNILGDMFVGGLIGWNNNDGNVINSYTSGTINSNENQDGIGGFTGMNEGYITDSYSTADVYGGSTLGGFSGSNQGGIINNSYSTGMVPATPNSGGFIGSNFGGGTSNNCFWDTNTSGWGTSDGPETGITTAEALNNFTYTNAGWDFTNTWFSVNGSTRPFLRMEYSTEISNSHQLQLMAMDLAADYTLANDIGLSDIVEVSQMWGTSVSGGGGFSPVGGYDGTFDGNNFTITGLYINRSTNNIGLFGTASVSSEVKDVNLEGVNVSGDTYVGSLAGIIYGTAQNIHSLGDVYGTNHNIGGLVGMVSTDASLYTSSFEGNVDGGGHYVGGLVGDAHGDVENSHAIASVSAGVDRAGGLVGIAYGNITDCYAEGTVTGNDLVGGLLGYYYGLYGSFNNSYSSSEVTGNVNVGGLIGHVDNPSTIIINSYATGNVNGTSNVGGLVGRNDDIISNCTASGNVNSTGNRVGGLAGINYGDVTESEAHGQVYAIGGNAGGLVGDNNPGAAVTNSSAYGDVTAEDIYCGGLTGRNGGIIKNSSAYGNVDAGTFGYVGGLVGDNNGGTIFNSSALGEVDGGTRTGGFVGSNMVGIIERCFSMGDVNALVDKWHGGFIGLNYDADVKDCYSQGNVTGNDQVGGFIGNNSDGSSISNSYSTGFVIGNTNVGGFAGINSIYGAPCTITNCTWDNETSGFVTTGIGGGAIGSTTGNYTSEMKQQATFDPPWDFADIWGIYDYNTYPFLETLGPSSIPDVDLEITIEGAPDPCLLNSQLQYYVNVTNHGTDIAVNTIVNITLPAEVIWNSDNQSDVAPINQFLEENLGNMNGGDSWSWLINVTVDTFAGTITATADITSDTPDLDLFSNTDTANTIINRAPTAENKSYQTTEDSVYLSWAPGVLWNANDLDGDSIEVISYAGDDFGANITIESDGNFTYDPSTSVILQNLKNGQSLNDTFNYTISDSRGGFANATITIQIDGIDDAPIANNDTFIVDEDSGPYSLDVLANDVADEEGDDFYIAHGSSSTSGVMAASADGLTLIYTPYNTNYTGSDVFTYMISDGNVTDTASVDITITPMNDAPVAQANLFHVDEDSGINTLYVLDGAVDAEGDDLIISAITQPDHGIVLITESGKNLTYEPDANFFGDDFFNYTISDGNGGTDTMMVRVQVDSVNDEPIITTTVLPDGIVGIPYTFTMNATDIDIDNSLLGWGGTSDADWLTIQATGIIRGTPTAAGTFWVNIVVNDGDGVNTPNIVTKNLTLTVTASETDTDGDGVPDTTDAFPTDPAASVDTDGDGFPDAWNDGYTADDSTTDLVLDDDPETPNNLGEDVDETGANLWLYIIIILVVVGAIAGYLVMRGKGKEPVVEEPVTDVPMETPEESILEETAPVEETPIEPDVPKETPSDAPDAELEELDL